MNNLLVFIRIKNIALLAVLLLITLACETQKPKEQSEKINTKIDYVDKGKDFVLKGDCKNAIEAFTKAISVDDKNPDVFFDRAYCLEYMGKYEEALADYDKAISLNAQFTDAYNNRGEIKRRFKKDYKGAIADYTKAIELKNDLAGIYFNRALAEVASQQQEEALADFTKVIELNPNVADAYYNRAALYMAKGYKEKACKDWAQAYELGKEESADLVKEYCL